ncbi:Protein MEI2-like 2 [Astathelohania contejeani]|uniref:Protein MEI2-like 2 n=1 Tax=Astathelohania contejeani TaxID=164912 RepID=A0ABQ7HX70_9MICR|nr:Protein MEI2-like 2 [Thelohania contejeani]
MKKSGDEIEQKVTRTLLITGINPSTNPKLIRSEISKHGAIKETYTSQQNPSILFIIFYDIRESQKVFETFNNTQLLGSNIKMYYTTSRYEVPKEIDKCDETKNQGTIRLVYRTDKDEPISMTEVRHILKPFPHIKAIREKTSTSKFIEFYDTRSTDMAYTQLNNSPYKEGKLGIKYVWDLSNKQRLDIASNTEKILRSCVVEKKKEEIIENAKRRKESSGVKKNFYLKMLDDFIAEHVKEIEKLL